MVVKSDGGQCSLMVAQVAVATSCEAGAGWFEQLQWALELEGSSGGCYGLQGISSQLIN